MTRHGRSGWPTRASARPRRPWSTPPSDCASSASRKTSRSLLDHAELASALARDEDVTFYQIVAPFDGTIIKKNAVPSQKADSNDVLFILADLRSVWVTANVSESDVANLPEIKGGTFRLTATAYPGREFAARLLSVGRSGRPADAHRSGPGAGR